MGIDVLGVVFDNLTPDEAVQRGAALAAEGFHYVVTPNPELVNLARANRSYRDLLNGADLTLPDGVGVVYASRLLGRPLSGRVPGIDFAAGLMELLARDKRRLYLLGAKPGVAEKAAENLKRTYPGLTVCGVHDGYFSDDEKVAEGIRASGADVVFVCLGAPKQEEWMVKYGPGTGAHLMVGLGGSLDVFAGTVKRAPEAWRKLGLEWLYRLLQQPGRVVRMAKLPLFLISAVRVRGAKDWRWK